MAFDKGWLGGEFSESGNLFHDTAGDGSVKAFGFRGPLRSIEVDLQTMRAVTTELYDKELTDEEWLSGWRHQVIEAARLKPFSPECSFCGKSDKEVLRLIAGPTVMICNECVTLCSDIMAE